MGKTLRILVAAEALSTELLEILAERHTYKWVKIIDQVQASAISVAHCIAEGHGRTTTGEKMQMLSIANGSLAETVTALRELEAVSILTNEEATGFVIRYRQLSVQILLFAAALFDRNPFYNGAYLNFVLRGIKLRTIIRERRNKLKEQVESTS